jgi:hypothetical protein
VRKVRARPTFLVLLAVGCHKTGSDLPETGPSYAPKFSSSTDFTCSHLATSMRVGYSLRGGGGLGSIGAPRPAGPPTEAERAAFLRPLLATMTVEPPSAFADIKRGLEERASDKVPAPAPAYLDCHGSTVVHRIERARVQFVVGADGKVDKVTVGLVDVGVDAGSPSVDFVLRCLAATPCAGVPFRDVPAGTLATYWYDRAASGIDPHGPELIEQEEQTETQPLGWGLDWLKDAGSSAPPAHSAARRPITEPQ